MVPVPQTRSQRNLLPDGRLMRRTSRKWLSRRLRTELEQESSCEGAGGWRAGRGWSHTPASSAQNLLSTCVGLGYPGKSYPRGESLLGWASRPRNAMAEERALRTGPGGSQSRGTWFCGHPYPNEASISRKPRPTTLTKMFVPCVRISQCSAP